MKRKNLFVLSSIVFFATLQGCGNTSESSSPSSTGKPDTTIQTTNTTIPSTTTEIITEPPVPSETTSTDHLSSSESISISTEPEVIHVTSVTLNKSELSMNVGESEALTLTILPENADFKEASWSSDNEGVAMVTDGLVKAVSQGEAEIAVTVDGKTARCHVTVKKPYDEFGSFKIHTGVKGVDYTINDNKIDMTGTFVAKAKQSYHNSYFKARLSQSIEYDASIPYGFLFGAKEENGKLNGFLYSPYVFNGGIWMRTGYLVNGVYESYGDIDCLFAYNGTDYMDYEIWIQNGGLGLRINEWDIHYVPFHSSGDDFYLLNQGKKMNFESITYEKFDGKMANKIYRKQWEGHDRYEYTETFREAQGAHCFKMTIPNELPGEITSLRLARYCATMVPNQVAEMTINDKKMTDNWVSETGTDFGDYFYDIPLSYATKGNTLNFSLKAVGEGEFCVNDYRLIMKIGEKEYIADSLILHSSQSEKEHEWKTNGVAFEGFQKVFFKKGNHEYLGFTKMAETIDILVPDIRWKADIEYTFTSKEDVKTINFFDFVDIIDNGSFEIEYVLWLGSERLGDPTHLFTNQEFSGRWYLDQFVLGCDMSAWDGAAHNMKTTAEGQLTLHTA